MGVLQVRLTEHLAKPSPPAACHSSYSYRPEMSSLPDIVSEKGLAFEPSEYDRWDFLQLQYLWHCPKSAQLAASFIG